MKDTDVAWAAGLFEGEGTIYIKGGVVKASIQMTDLDILERMRNLYGGSLVETKVAKEHYKRCWKWGIYGTARAKKFLRDIYPYLGSRRRARCEEAFAVETKEERKSSLCEQVLQMRAENMTHQEIATQLGYDRSYITHILRRNK